MDSILMIQGQRGEVRGRRGGRLGWGRRGGGLSRESGRLSISRGCCESERHDYVIVVGVMVLNLLQHHLLGTCGCKLVDTIEELAFCPTEVDDER